VVCDKVKLLVAFIVIPFTTATPPILTIEGVCGPCCAAPESTVLTDPAIFTVELPLFPIKLAITKSPKY
jgi:hypothetical protein